MFFGDEVVVLVGGTNDEEQTHEERDRVPEP
jgi:hypothetical protein